MADREDKFKKADDKLLNDFADGNDVNQDKLREALRRRGMTLPGIFK